jgi:hypothetical protein
MAKLKLRPAERRRARRLRKRNESDGELFVSQGDHGIDFHGAACREIASQRGHRE